jgi:hypothetical protein
MSTTETLQARLDKQADAKLAKEINDAVTPIERLLHGENRSVTVRVAGTNQTVETLTGYLLSALEDTIKSRLQERYRKAQTIDFMAKVESLADQVEELRNAAS